MVNRLDFGTYMMNKNQNTAVDIRYRQKLLFEKWPGAFELYLMLENVLLGLGSVHMEILKTQVAFSHGKRMAFVWPPIRKVKGRSGSYVIMTLCLNRLVEHPCLEEVVEAYPGRWTSHFVINSPEDIDDSLIFLITEA